MSRHEKIISMIQEVDNKMKEVSRLSKEASQMLDQVYILIQQEKEDSKNKKYKSVYNNKINNITSPPEVNNEKLTEIAEEVLDYLTEMDILNECEENNNLEDDDFDFDEDDDFDFDEDDEEDDYKYLEKYDDEDDDFDFEEYDDENI